MYYTVYEVDFWMELAFMCGKLKEAGDMGEQCIKQYESYNMNRL